MMLAEEQINRYLRHIIMPEISGAGQEKLLESSVFIYGDTISNISPFIYYIAASGIGHIYFGVNNSQGCDMLLSNIHDLNSDIIIEHVENPECISPNGISLRVVAGAPDFIIRHRVYKGFVRTIIAPISPWKGMLQLSIDQDELDSFVNTLEEGSKNPRLINRTSDFENSGYVLSSCFIGAAAAIESIKLCLNIGNPLNSPLFFDLFEMEFSRVDLAGIELYIRNLFNNPYMDESFIPSFVQTSSLLNSKVLLVGAGGLGSPNAYALSLAGVGTIGLIDYDVVEMSNLNRQILHSYSRIGMHKAKSAEVFIKSINPKIKLASYNTSLNKENVLEIIKDYDVIIGCVDNLPTRYILNDACFILNKPLIEAGVLRFAGLGMTIIPGKSPCYRCIFPEIPKSRDIQSCSESGILGPVPGLLGFIQASEAIKIISGRGKLLDSRLIFYDALDAEFRIVNINKNPTCPLCGSEPSIKSL